MDESSKPHFTQSNLDNLTEEAQKDGDILGFFLGGSRSKGFEDQYSDWDLRYVVRDGTREKFSSDPTNPNFEASEYSDMESQVFEYGDFVQHAQWKKDKAWDRYSFSHVNVLVDKTGDIQKLVDEKCRIPEEEQKPFVTKEIDAYVHGLYRSIKAARRDDLLGSRIEAVLSVYHLVAGLFATEFRTAPYPSYLSNELRHYPLERFPMSGGALASLLERTSTGEVNAQQELAKAVEAYMSLFDFYSYERWADKYAWLMTFREET